MTPEESAARPGRTHLRWTSSRPFNLGDAVVTASANSGLPAPIVAALMARADSRVADWVSTHPNTSIVETNVARMPGFAVSRAQRATRIDWVPVGVANGRFVEILSPAGRLTVQDMLLLIHLSTAYLRLGCPGDRRVPISLNELADALGYGLAGGKTLRLVEACLHRLMGVVIRMQLRYGRVEGMAEWHLLDRWFKVSKGSRQMGAVWLSEDYAQLVMGGNVTLLDTRVLRALAATPRIGGIATRLYVMLEAQQGPSLRPWHFPVFRADASSPPMGAYSPLVDILGLTDARRPRILAKLRAAMQAIENADPHYVGQLLSSHTKGQTNLVVHRRSKDSRGSEPGTTGARTRDFVGQRPVRKTAATSIVNVDLKRRGPQKARSTVAPSASDRQGTAVSDMAESPGESLPPSADAKVGEIDNGGQDGLSEFHRRTLVLQRRLLTI